MRHGGGARVGGEVACDRGAATQRRHGGGGFSVGESVHQHVCTLRQQALSDDEAGAAMTAGDQSPAALQL